MNVLKPKLSYVDVMLVVLPERSARAHSVRYVLPTEDMEAL